MARKAQATGGMLESLSEVVAEWSGSTGAFLWAVGIVLVWAVLGPVFGFSNTWQLVINTGTTVVTFLMVFLIQRSQNKNSRAVHIKLNELVAAINGASNRLIDVESLSERELAVLHRHYIELAKLAGADANLTASHSVEEARNRHQAKKGKLQ
jgi:low affinity Fe/Cu permease